MSKKKIVHIIPELQIGGAENLAAGLAARLAEKYEVYFIVLYHDVNKDMQDKLKFAGVRVITLDKKPGLHLKSFYELWKKLSEISPDIVHTHLQAALYAVPWYIFHKKNIKIHTIHSMPKKEFPRLHIEAMKLAYHFLKVLPVAISPAIADEAAELYLMDKSQIPIIYNGIDTAPLIDHARHVHEGFRIIQVASFSPWKNQAFVLDVLNLCLKQNPKIKLTFAGSGALLNDVKTKAGELGFSSDTVEFLGERGDIPQLLLQSDIFVLCSLFEGVPLSVLEAYAAGLPVVSAAVGGVPDILTDGENGFLIPPNDAEAFSAAILKLIDDKTLYNRISKQNRIKAERFDISVIADSYITLYEGNKG